MTKICTSIDQSKKLIELGIDVNTADMHYYKNYFGDYIEGLYNSNDLKDGFELKGIEYIPAWSLSALLDIVPFPSLHKTFDGWRCDSYNKEGTSCIPGEIADNSVDACYKMIIKLY